MTVALAKSLERRFRFGVVYFLQLRMYGR